MVNTEKNILWEIELNLRLTFHFIYEQSFGVLKSDLNPANTLYLWQTSQGNAHSFRALTHQYRAGVNCPLQVLKTRPAGRCFLWPCRIIFVVYHLYCHMSYSLYKLHHTPKLVFTCTLCTVSSGTF